ncbi:MAG: hypothetical protein KA171_00425 [Reyranella sp.]|jgi:hypothetical protein|nr:hypothetical protein [Reyranella sp.]
MSYSIPLYGYDPRGIVQAEARPLAPRVADLRGLRLGVLDNAKMKAGKLLTYTADILNEEFAFSQVNTFVKRGFSYTADPEMIAQIAASSDVVITAIGD